MNDTIYVAIIGGISGLVTGAIASLVAPWVSWGIEQRREKKKRQRSIIDWARHSLSSGPMRREQIRKHEHYAAIRAYLSADLVSNIEAQNRTGGEQAIQDNIMRELAVLERKWGLV